MLVQKADDASLADHCGVDCSIAAPYAILNYLAAELKTGQSMRSVGSP
jgi:hypothetical protein